MKTMAPLLGNTVVIDEDEAIIIGDESEDEIEILEHGFPGAPKTPSIHNLSPRSASHTNPNSHRRPERSSDLGGKSATSPPHNHRSLVSSPFYKPLVSRTVRAPTNPSEASITLSPTRRRLSRSKTLSLDLPRRMSSSRMPEPSTADADLRSSTQPIELEERTFIDATQRKDSEPRPQTRHSSDDGSDSSAARIRHSLAGLNSEGDAVEPGTLIDLEELENFDDLWNDEEELQILRVEERKVSQPCQTSSKVAALQRNSPIIAPMQKIPEWPHKSFLLRPSKTAELLDGDFLLITDIIRHSISGEVTIRGQRLQRCRSMNGLLEKKLNEVCFFQEVDLDDPRPPMEQSAIEVSLVTEEAPVDKVRGLRSLRKINQIFPLGRNLEIERFRTQAQAVVEGGLTARWKYTCTYATAADRCHNNPKERTLAFLREDECTKEFGASDTARRFDWRGETIPAGAYRPELDDGKYLVEVDRKESVISLASSTFEPESGCVILDLPLVRSESLRSGEGNANATSFSFRRPSRKRRASSSVVLIEDASRKHSKKVRLEDGDEMEIETTRKDLSTLSVEEQQIASSRGSATVDLTVGSPSSQNRRHSLTGANTVSSPSSQNLLTPKLQTTMDLYSSDLATPAPIGTIRSYSASPHGPVIRSPGQKLTYGDAFCGAGGTTRGAAMAGLRVLWGFDHWKHACSTWRFNFPKAICYELSSQQFVSRAQGSKYRKSVDMKVDILHLSPPCQYFSPAHTVDCPSDEMNVASLYAVGPVIKVAKPRVVTLEQTFGIVAARFRKYFNSLIQMFTALSFSVRWAIVPLAQWGLPQRRYRLIIIAACPGEILPAMPSPTHADPDSKVNNLPPFSTVNDTLASIPLDAPDHDPAALIFPTNKRLRSWDGNTILPRAMTTSGGQNYHPSGKRDFTLREYAALQGFPPNHVFAGSYVKKQVGNAVPPVVAKVLFESIKRQLDEVDGVVQQKETMVID